ncbi:MAG: hypothetical protein WCC95_18120 [Candidatus Sulfotelmatobacter sp.]
MKLPTSPTAGIRNHPSNWTKEPEKANTHCLYCKQPATNHAADCHVPLRTVVVEFKTKMVIRMPQTWDENMVNFTMNESSACMSRYVDQLYEETHEKENLCQICFRSEMKYLREATAEDHAELHYIDKVED